MTGTVTYGQFIDSDVKQEVIVMFQPNIMQLPTGVMQSSVEQLLSVAPQVRALLVQHQVDRISRAFPDFNSTDTIRITSEGRTIKSMDLSRVFVLRLPKNQNRNFFINSLIKLPNVIYAEPNAMGRERFIPNDVHFNNQWGLRNTGQAGGTSGTDIKAVEAWDIFTGSSNVTIGIVDVGRVQEDHPDFAGRVSGDFSSSINPHSTHVAGIAAAKGNNNSTGIAGIDWNAQINTQTMGDIPQQALAIRAAVNAGARIINNSWGQGNNSFSVTVASAFADAYKSNVVSCNAMPQTGSEENYPNAYGQGIINVAASTNGDKKASYSLPRSFVDVAAPGGNGDANVSRDIYSTVSTSTYAYNVGTSMAAPHGAGIASLLIGYGQDILGITLYNDDIEQIIRISADDINDSSDPTTGPDWDQGTGDGRVNARAALDLIRSPNTVNQWTASGGSSVGNTDYYTMTFFDTPGLSNGAYNVKRYDVQKNVTFSSTFESTPNVWGRGAATNGYSGAYPNFGMGWSNVVSSNQTSAVLQTYVYEVWNALLGQYLGWYPTSPGNVTFAYTVLGVPYTPPPLSVSISGLRFLGFKQSETYNANVNGGSGSTSYQWYRKDDGQSNWYTHGTSQSQLETMIRTNFNLKVDVTRGSETASATVYVEYGDEPPPFKIADFPKTYSLSQNHPNPFNPTTTIQYDLPEPSHVLMVVYDLLGHEVEKWENAYEDAGFRHFNWNGTDVNGNRMPSGMYIYKLTARSLESNQVFTQSHKMMLMK